MIDLMIVHQTIPGYSLGPNLSGVQYYLFPCDAPVTVGWTFAGNSKRFDQNVSLLVSQPCRSYGAVAELDD